MATKSILINWEEGIEMKSIALLIQKLPSLIQQYIFLVVIAALMPKACSE